MTRNLLLVGLAAAFVPANATVSFYFSTPIDSAPTPGGTGPWATVDITDNGLDSVLVTLSHSATSAAGQFITRLYLNANPYPGSPGSSWSSSKITGVAWDEDGRNDASSSFDVEISFATSNANSGANRLKPGESVSLSLTGTGLDETDFMALSGGNAERYGMIHLQGLANGQSTKLVATPVPEPASLAALAIGAAALLKRRKK